MNKNTSKELNKKIEKYIVIHKSKHKHIYGFTRIGQTTLVVCPKHMYHMNNYLELNRKQKF